METLIQVLIIAVFIAGLIASLEGWNVFWEYLVRVLVVIFVIFVVLLFLDMIGLSGLSLKGSSSNCFYYC
jgi:hypothetical protein